LVKVRVFFLCHIPSFYPKKNCTSKGNLVFGKEARASEKQKVVFLDSSDPIKKVPDFSKKIFELFIPTNRRRKPVKTGEVSLESSVVSQAMIYLLGIFLFQEIISKI